MKQSHWLNFEKWRFESELSGLAVKSSLHYSKSVVRHAGRSILRNQLAHPLSFTASPQQ
jgi:hypothetical protein